VVGVRLIAPDATANEDHLKIDGLSYLLTLAGVFLNRQRKWLARIRIPDGRRLELGSFVDEEDAARAYDRSVSLGTPR
jgi:hypothetical protein